MRHLISPLDFSVDETNYILMLSLNLRVTIV